MNSNSAIILFFQIAILIMSVVVHEASHGLAAYRLGDPTAKDYGRITLNPLSHLDFFGSFLVPILLWLASGGTFVFGWAKPVPYNPYNLRNQKRDPALVALAGPISNFLLALFFGLIFKFFGSFLLSSSKAELGIIIFQSIILINIVLAIFNLIPIPPLDGSKILFAALPPTMDKIKISLERYGMIILIGFLILDSYTQILTILVSVSVWAFTKALGISYLFL
ncbi:MAG: site-2 protease family protein [bacterium]